MGLTETEFSIIKIFAESKEASLGLIANKAILTPGYTEYLCKYLVKGGYLEQTSRGAYSLTPQGREALTGRTRQILWDQRTIQAIAKELAKQLGGAAVLPRAGKKLKREVELSVPARKAIMIKESFVDPGESGIILKYGLSRKPKESRTSSAGIEKTLKALKKLK